MSAAANLTLTRRDTLKLGAAAVLGGLAEPADVALADDVNPPHRQPEEKTMRTIRILELTIEAFFPFGFFANHLSPTGEKITIGGGAIEFYRDMAQQDLGGVGIASFSTCRVAARPWVIDVTEYHTKTSEALLPLDNDVLIHVGPATRGGNAVPLDKIKVFRVPRGTLVVLRPGVWHHAPFSANSDPANVLIVLPERIYANECFVVELPPADHIRIEKPA